MEAAYLGLLRAVRDGGEDRPDRTGVGTRSLFGAQLRGDLREGFPLLTTKRIHWRSVVEELLWMLRGETSTARLRAAGVTIWDEWADAEGQLGPVYGAQWRHWRAPDGRVIDQLGELLTGLRERPHSRRHIISAWNPADLPDESRSPQANVAEGRMALAPCHAFMQFYVSTAGGLSCHLYQRSADLFLGVPFNIASYALLTHLVAAQVGLQPEVLVMSFGDVHLYRNHFGATDGPAETWAPVDRQLARAREWRNPPTLHLHHVPARIEETTFADLDLRDYHPHGSLPAPIAV